MQDYESGAKLPGSMALFYKPIETWLGYLRQFTYTIMCSTDSGPLYWSKQISSTYNVCQASVLES